MTLFKSKQKAKTTTAAVRNVVESQTPVSKSKHVVTVLSTQMTIAKDEENPKKIIIQMFGTDPTGKDETVLELLVDEDKPLTEEEKEIHYKSPKNVMAARKIRELMNAHRKATLKKSITGKSSDVKTKFVVGLALTLQIIAVLLIFI